MKVMCYFDRKQLTQVTTIFVVIDGSDRRDKVGGVTEERGHHIQVDGNGYVEKTIPRGLSNGCGPPPNRMNITANPLADADDNQVRYILFFLIISVCAVYIQPYILHIWYIGNVKIHLVTN